MKKDQDQRKFKSDTRNLIDVTLLGICITFFGLVATIRPELLQNKIFTIQLVLTIPLFMCGLLSRIKEASYVDSQRWANLVFVSTVIGYGFFTNIIGLALSFITPIGIALTFFVTSIGLNWVRAGVVISYDKTQTKRRLIREIAQVAIIVFLGILPAIRFY
ncbi:MAG: hypothetical protein WCI72_04135 [archaeon]